MSYDLGVDGYPSLNITLRLSGQGNGPASELLFIGVRQLDIRLGDSQPTTHEVLVTSVRADNLEDLNYKVSSDLGDLEFHFYCKEIQGKPGQHNGHHEVEGDA
jgi:hypothetical protein